MAPETASEAPATEVVRTMCRMCHGACGVLVTLENGSPVDIRGDPDCVTNLGYICTKGRASASYTKREDRIIHPMRRVGPRGSGQWERISWKEALDLVEEKVRKAIAEHGAESIGKACGTGREWNNFGNRFFNALGAVLNVGRSPLCYFPRIVVGQQTMGTKIPVADFYGFGGQLPRCVLVWGNDPFNNADGMIGGRLRPALKEGAKIITIDPLETHWSRRSDCWLQVRPVTDGALALGLLHVVLLEGLYDVDFVSRWTNAPFLMREDTGDLFTGEAGEGESPYRVWDPARGEAVRPDECPLPALEGRFEVEGVAVRPAWEGLLDRVREYPPERVSEITWVPAEKIREAARMFATTKPAVIQWGNALDHQGVNNTQTMQAAILLMALTGNLDVPGGMAMWELGPWVDPFSPEHDRPMPLPEGSQKMVKKYGVDQFPILGMTHGSLVNLAIVSGELHVPVCFIIGHNFLLTAENTKTAVDVMHKIPFSVTIDLFMTPTAELSDLFLPTTTWLERDQITTPYNRFGIFARKKVVEPAGECRDDEDILLELAHRLGLDEAFPWKTVEEYFDWRLERSGFKWKEFKEMGQLLHPQNYRKYETDHFRKGGGFDTPTGRVEVYQTKFRRLGDDPFPYYVEPKEESPHNEELAREYPLISTVRRTAEYFHSEHHNVPELRRRNPDPIVEMHPETARGLGIADGDWVWIETKQGRIRQRARLIEGIHPKVVCNQHAWWYPERGGPDYGVWLSNLNVITRNDPGQGFDPLYGGPQLRGFLCKIYPAEEAP
ncbi:MAG: molybdopterin-dependent oxidoreductase [bacterium]